MNKEEESKAIEATEAEMKELGLTPAPEEAKEETGKEIVSPEMIEKEEAEKSAEADKSTEPAPAKETEQDKKEKPDSDKEKQETPEPKQILVRDYKKFTKGYKDTIEKLEAEVAKYKANPTLANKEAVESAKATTKQWAESLATKLNFKPEQAEILANEIDSRITSLIPKSEMSEEDKKAIQSVKDREVELEQQEIFNEEWTDTEVSLKTQFPNATAEQLAKAKATMKELAYTDQYVEKEMDYILFKEKSKFDAVLFSPKQKTFESGKTPTVEFNESDELEDFPENGTPAEVLAWEKKRDRIVDNAPKQKTKITSRGEERYE